MVTDRTGLLLVHGMGSQARTTVLSSSCDALIRWLQQRHGRDAVALGAVSLGLGEDRSDEPPSARLTLPEGVTWVVAESRWAENFVEPRFSRLLPWTLGAVVRVADHEVRLLLAKTEGGIAERTRPSALSFPWRPYWTWPGARHLRALVILTVLPLALVGLLAASALRAVPAFRDFAQRLQSVLSGTIGDSFTFVESPTNRVAIVQQVRRDLDWLKAQGVEDIVVAAHSQGAAVAHEAMRGWGGDGGGRVDLLTYGSGLDKLTFLADRTGGPTGWRVSLLLGLGLVLNGGVVAMSYGVLGVIGDVAALNDTPLALAIAGVSVAGALAVALAWIVAVYWPFYRSARVPQLIATAVVILLLILASSLLLYCIRFDEAWVRLAWIGGALIATAAAYGVAWLALRGDNEGGPHIAKPRSVRHWWDVRSTADLVASSSSRRDKGRFELVIHNRRSALFDHTSYWSNWSEFIPIVVNAMAWRRSEHLRCVYQVRYQRERVGSAVRGLRRRAWSVPAPGCIRSDRRRATSRGSDSDSLGGCLQALAEGHECTPARRLRPADPHKRTPELAPSPLLNRAADRSHGVRAHDRS